MMIYTDIDELLGQLRAVQRRRWLVRLAAGLCVLFVVAGASLLLVAGALGYWRDQPPAVLRWAVPAVMASACLVAAGLFARRVLLWRQTPAQTARFVEGSQPDLRNNLINAVLLADDADQPSPDLVQQAIGESVRSSRRVDLLRTVATGPLKKWAAVAAFVAVAVALLAGLQGGPMRRALAAVASPGWYVPHANDIVAESIVPGDVTVFTGQTVTIVARIENPRAARHRAKVVLLDTDQSSPMLASEANTTYTCTIGPVAETLRYVVHIGGSRWPHDRPWFTITVIEQLAVESFSVRYEHPPYTRLEPRTVDDFTGRIEAPTGSAAELTLKLSQSAPAVRVDAEGGAAEPMLRSDDGRTFAVSLPVEADGRYRLVVVDDRGGTLQRLPDGGEGGSAAYDAADNWFPIVAVPDAPPKIAFLSPGRDVSAAVDGSLPTLLQVSDDYGLLTGALYAARRGEPFKVVHNYAVAAGRGGRFSYELTLDALGPLQDGDVIDYYAEAADTRDMPGSPAQTARTRQFHITVRAGALLATEAARRQEQLRKRLAALLAAQAAQRVNAAICLSEHESIAQLLATGGEIVTGQESIHAELADLAENFTFDAETVIAQQALAGLAGNEAPLAVDQARVLAELNSFGARVGPCQSLGRTQEAIISRLEMLLAVMAASDASPDELAAPTGDDLRSDPREAAERLEADLAEFAESQSRLIRAMTDLAKTPVDDFTAADEQSLADLQAQADRLEQFIDEAFSDLSKLPQQDFANPSLLAELLAIRTDVTMARDALSKRAMEIAVAASQVGLENAEQLTANLERWLPDEPDRRQWSMEDPQQQENIEQAELPTALEDLVGDLLEQEEDLFDEIDDITSAWADSLNKGAGWDAMDGPISSMNAQGVTGNQLPNTSEIAGRSGEGRTAKASGEYVQANAVGRGGRRTPTRLTEEPYQAGRVDDTSAEPPGGSTGGGKMSGAGAEGLEGPVPPELGEQLDRLAGQQAAIISRAERLRAQLAPGDYANFRLLEAITLMNRLRGDLAGYRYRNVLRTRQAALGALRDAHDLLAGEVDVVGDTSTDVPRYIRDNINNAMDPDLPEEFRDHLEQYYRRLGEQGGQ